MKKDYRSRRDNSPTVRGAKVTVRNGDVNGALRTLKKILDRDNRQKELAKREFYEKPTSVRKRKAAAAVKRHLKKIQRESRKTQRLY